jgi:hypothetical protein
VIKALSLLFLVALGTAPSPHVKAVSVPRHAVKGVPWHAVVTITPPARATLRVIGPKRLTVPLRPTKQRGRYQATLRFPFAGSWRLAVTVGHRTTHLGSVAVDVPRDPLVQDPISIAAEPSGSLVVGQLQSSPVLRIAHARALKLADGPGVFHVYVAGSTTYAAGRDGVVYRLDGSKLTPLTPPMDASAVAVDDAGNLYVAIYVGWIRKVAPDGTVTNVAGNGTEGYSGDGGPATSAQLFHPHSVAIGKDGALYIADTENRHIRRVDLATGRISTFGGTVGITVSLAQHLLVRRRTGRGRRRRHAYVYRRRHDPDPPLGRGQRGRGLARRRGLRERVADEADPAADARGKARAGRPRLTLL